MTNSSESQNVTLNIAKAQVQTAVRFAHALGIKITFDGVDLFESIDRIQATFSGDAPHVTHEVTQPVATATRVPPKAAEPPAAVKTPRPTKYLISGNGIQTLCKYGRVIVQTDGWTAKISVRGAPEETGNIITTNQTFEITVDEMNELRSCRPIEIGGGQSILPHWGRSQ